MFRDIIAIIRLDGDLISLEHEGKMLDKKLKEEIRYIFEDLSPEEKDLEIIKNKIEKDLRVKLTHRKL